MQQGLTDWLLERVAEDERDALNASGRAVGGPYNAEWTQPWAGQIDVADGHSIDTNDRDLDQHIIRWDPARVLAEVESKRRIINEHLPADFGHEFCRICSPLGERFASFPCDTLRLLALPYAGMPGWNEAWRP